MNGGAFTVTATVAPQMTEVTAYAIVYHIRYVAQLQSCTKRNWGATCSLIDKAAGSGSTLHSTFIDLHMDMSGGVLHTYIPRFFMCCIAKDKLGYMCSSTGSPLPSSLSHLICC